MGRAVRTLLRTLAGISLLCAQAALADKPAGPTVVFPVDYDARYVVEKYDSEVASLQYRLRHKAGRIEFTTQARVSGFASLLRDDRAEERSVLRNSPEPTLQSYRFRRSGDAAQRNTQFHIDWQGKRGTARGDYAGKTFQLAVTQPVWDPLSVQLALMRDMLRPAPSLAYAVIHKGRLKRYVFERLADDSIEIDEVFYDCVVLQRRHNNRLTRFWLAKDYQFIPVLIENHKNGELDSRILLDSFTLHE